MDKTFDFSRLDGHRHLIDLFTMPISMSWMLNPNPVQPHHRDLIDLVRAVQIADRYTPRPRINELRDTSARTLTIVLPVRDPDRWNQPEVVDALVRALHFLTQDTWTVSFVPRTEVDQDDNMTRLDLGGSQNPRTFGLFSGGLDSVAGTALLLNAQPNHTHVAVAGLGSNLTELQDTTVESIEHEVKQSRPEQPYPLAGVRYHTPLQHRLIAEHFADQHPNEEYTQRSRGFVFLGMGAAVANQDGQQELYVFEHGVGGINLAYNAASIGVDLTRAMHPYFIALMSQFLTLVFGSPFVIRNPHWFHSKGQVLEALKAQGSAALVIKSRSCDSNGNRNQPQDISAEVPHCGGCSSCILRRLATFFADVPDTRYGTDPIRVLRSSVTPRPYALNTYAQMRTQSRKLRQVIQSTPASRQFVALLTAFPDLRLAYDGFRLLGISTEAIKTGVVQLYTSYVQEWDIAEAREGRGSA